MTTDGLIFDIDAEESTIGSVLIDGGAFGLISETITHQDFYDERNRWIFQAFEELHKRRESIDQITAATELQRKGRLEECGGAAYMSHLVSIVPTSLDIEHYAEIVRRLSFHRQLVQLGTRFIDEAKTREPDTNLSIDRISSMLESFRKKNIYNSELITPEAAADRLLSMVNDYAEEVRGIPFGFKDLDKLTAGMFPGELTIIGGDSGTGKTELIMNIMQNIQNKQILFISTEMNLEGLLERKVSQRLNISITELRRGKLPFEYLQKLGDLQAEMYAGNIYTSEKTQTSHAVYNLVSRMKESTGVDIVFVDYLQRLKDAKESKERNDLDIAKAANNLKNIAKDFNIPVISISSFNRDYKSRDNKTPVLSDLRGSGEIQFEADNIYLVYRNTEHTESDDEVKKYGDPRILKIKLAKGRQVGTKPAISLVWNDERRCYVDYFKD